MLTGRILEVDTEGDVVMYTRSGMLTRIPYHMVTKLQYHNKFKAKELKKDTRFLFTDNAVKLHDGTVLSEQVMDSLVDDSISIRLVNGELMRLSINDVVMRKPRGYWRYKDAGYYLSYQWGLNWSRRTWSDAVFVDGMSFHIIQGWKYNPKFGIGLGTGIDTYGSTTVVPVYASLQYWPIKGKVMPVIQAGAGDSFAWSNAWGERETTGGRMLQTGLGVQVNGPRHAFLMMVNYREQAVTQIRDAGWWWGSGETEEFHKHRNIVISVGMTF